MGIWSHVRTLTGLNPVWFTSDGTDIYFVGNDAIGNDVYQYTPATDTLTIIFDNAVITDWVRCKGLTYFDDNLYALIERDSGTNALQVARFDGSPNSFTVVKSMPRILRDYCDLVSNVTEMVVWGVRDFSDLQETHYTDDGTIWNVGTWASDPHVHDLVSVFNHVPYTTAWPLGFFMEICRGVTTTCTSLDVDKWNTIAKQWQIEQAGIPVRLLKFSDPANAQHWQTTNGAFTTNFINQFIPDANKAPTIQFNMPFTLSVDLIDDGVYEWDGVAWQLLDTTPFTFSGSDAFVVKMANDIPYYFIEEFGTFSGEYVVLERDTPIVSPAAGGFQHSEGGVPGLVI